MHPMSKKEKKPEDVTPEEQTEQAVPTEETEAEAPNPLLEELEALKKSLSDQEDKFLRPVSYTHLPWLVYPFFHLSETAGSITTMMLTFIGVFLALRAFDSVNALGVLRGGGDVRAATCLLYTSRCV